MCWTKWELVLSHPDLQPLHTFIHRRTPHEEMLRTGEARCMWAQAWNTNIDPARKPIKWSDKHGDSPPRRPHACTVSRPGPCRCRAAGNCWPSPSCHTVPVWQQSSPPSAPWGPPGARAPGRSPGETSLLPLQEGREAQAERVHHTSIFPICRGPPGIQLAHDWTVIVTKDSGLDVYAGSVGELIQGGERLFSFWNVCSLALELIESRILQPARLCSAMHSTISPDALSSVVLRGIHSVHIIVSPSYTSYILLLFQQHQIFIVLLAFTSCSSN